MTKLETVNAGEPFLSFLDRETVPAPLQGFTRLLPSTRALVRVPVMDNGQTRAHGHPFDLETRRLRLDIRARVWI